MRIELTATCCVVLSLLMIVSPKQALGQASKTDPDTVTLIARETRNNYDNYTQAAFNFRLGVNGDDALRNPRNQWDLLYGNITLNGDKDWFTVAIAADDRSRIKELGQFNWSDHIEIPVLPACPDEEKSCTAVVFPSASSGKKLTDVNANIARAVEGHMYLVHTKDRETDFYALFRVEELRPSESCTISWQLIPSPEE